MIYTSKPKPRRVKFIDVSDKSLEEVFRYCKLMGRVYSFTLKHGDKKSLLIAEEI